MKLKMFALIISVVCVFTTFTACGDDTGSNSTPGYTQVGSNSGEEIVSGKPEVEKYYNNLTGCYVEGSKNKENLRPVAVMINNLGKAQKVQTGLADASIIYETFVEGGITRLLAIYKDVGSVGEIGSVRSARYSYVDLANGHDALYFHCGLDKNYTQKLMKQLNLDNIDINTGIYGDYGYRVKNGLAREHTMYTTGELIAKALERVNLQPDYMYRYPHEFSGGQRQRICVAKALVLEPKLIVCDEPVSALDVSIQAQLLNLMNKLQADLGVTFIFIAHDLSVVQYMSDRIGVMYFGNMVELADADELYNNTMHPYTEALLSAVPVPVINGKRDRIILEGDVPSPMNPPTGCPFHPRCTKCMEICKQEKPQLQEKRNGHFVACHLFDNK